jgi:hypothetical protein
MEGANDVTPLPPFTMEPALAALYQSIVTPVGTVALNVTAPALQRELLLALVGTAGAVFIVAPTGNRVADTQPVVLLRAWA